MLVVLDQLAGDKVLSLLVDSDAEIPLVGHPCNHDRSPHALAIDFLSPHVGGTKLRWSPRGREVTFHG